MFLVEWRLMGVYHQWMLPNVRVIVAWQPNFSPDALTVVLQLQLIAIVKHSHQHVNFRKIR